jgi:hypothetical protein
VYTATLTAGAFEILDGDGNPIEITVTPNSTESELRGVQIIDMIRPDDANPAADTWDEVFNECADLLNHVPPGPPVDRIVAEIGDWQIDQAGGVVLRLMTIRLYGIDDAKVEVDVGLWGDRTSRDSFLPVKAGDTSTFWLTTATIHGQSLPGAGPRRSCRRGGGSDVIDLGDHASKLEITASSPLP